MKQVQSLILKRQLAFVDNQARFVTHPAATAGRI